MIEGVLCVTGHVNNGVNMGDFSKAYCSAHCGFSQKKWNTD